MRYQNKMRCRTLYYVFVPVTGIFLVAIPYNVWYDITWDLPFCSIANLYGTHWDIYQHVAVTVLSILVGIMFVISSILLKLIYR